MTTAQERLRRVQLKIERAKKHIADLEFEREVFFSLNPYGTRIEHDPETREQIHRFQINRPVHDSIPLTIGDVVHNLRTALDHLAYQLVEANGQAPTWKTGFPIRKTPEAYKTVDKAIIKGIAADPLKLIGTIQPYQSGYDGLGALTELDNFDKHCALVIAAVGVVKLGMFIPKLPEGAPEHTYNMRFTWLGASTGTTRMEILQEGQELARVQPATVGGLIDPEMYPQPHIAFEIAFHQPKVVEGEPVVPLLTQLTQLVERVVQQFAPFL